jgi:hypothetical protein
VSLADTAAQLVKDEKPFIGFLDSAGVLKEILVSK